MHQTHPVHYIPPLPDVPPQMAYVEPAPKSQPPTKYTNQAATWALRLSCQQILSGIACVTFQAVATGLKRTFEKESRKTNYSIDYMGIVDVAGTGIWVGILMFICGVVGVFAAKENKRGKIGAHLGLNIVMLVITPALIGTTSPSIEGIGSCLDGYRSFYSWNNYARVSDCYPYPCSTSTTTQATFLGQPVSDGCQTPFFKGWMAMVCLLQIIAAVNFILSLVLLVMNGKYLSGCCCCDNRVTPVPQQQVMCNARYTPGQPFAVAPGYPTPSYAPGFHQIGQPLYYPQQQWVQRLTSTRAAGDQANPPVCEEKFSHPPASYHGQFAPPI